MDSTGHRGDVCGTEHLRHALPCMSSSRSFIVGTTTNYLKGQAGIYNYKPTYVPGHVVGSVVIAVVATTIALTLFFILRKNFTNSWYKRVLCAIILSGAVSGMHWTAALGTVYQVNTEAGNRFGHDTRHMTVVITIVMVSYWDEPLSY